jgi:hypothetical protein
MKTFPITIGKGPKPVSLDAAEVLGSCVLIQGARKSGKSYLARVIAEQTIGKMQTIVLDPEGEFATLRETFDILIAGKEGDVPTETRSAKLLARRIAETGVSTVVDFSDLLPDDRQVFVRDFLSVFNTLPKKNQNRPRLFILDEAHVYAPESGKGTATSTKEVILLLSQGRKRGYGTILLTQRLSKLRNDAASECGTILVGKTSPIDTARAVDLLGVERKEKDVLKRLRPGEFYGDGSALSVPEPMRFDVRKALTTHPEPGSRYKLVTPPPRKAIKKILAEFESLPPPKDVEDAQSLAEAMTRIRELERELRVAQKPPKAGGSGSKMPKAVTLHTTAVDLGRYVTRKDYETLEKAAKRREELLEAQADRLWAASLRQNQTLVQQIDAAIQKYKRDSKDPSVRTRVALPKLPTAQPVEGARHRPASSAAPSSSRKVEDGVARRASSRTSRNGSASGLDRMLQALAQHKRLSKQRWGIVAGLSSTTGTFRNYVSRGKLDGWWRMDGGEWEITEDGVKAAGHFEPLPLGSDLVNYWKRHKSVQTKAGEMLDFIASRGEEGATKEEVAAEVNISCETGTFRNYISRIRVLCLISGKGTDDDRYVAAESMRA